MYFNHNLFVMIIFLFEVLVTVRWFLSILLFNVAVDDL